MSAAVEFLDAHYGAWDEDSLALWEYILPAIHKLYPDRRGGGYAALFGPVRPQLPAWMAWTFWLVPSVLFFLICGIGLLYVIKYIR